MLELKLKNYQGELLNIQAPSRACPSLIAQSVSRQSNAGPISRSRNGQEILKRSLTVLFVKEKKVKSTLGFSFTPSECAYRHKSRGIRARMHRRRNDCSHHGNQYMNHQLNLCILFLDI